MFGRGIGLGRLEVDRLCAEVVEAAQRPKDSACAVKIEELITVLERRRAENMSILHTGLAIVEIEKVYAALSWLLREDGGAKLADSARTACFRCLRLLAEDWYPAWTTDDFSSYKRWHNLVGMGVYLLLRSAQLPASMTSKPTQQKEGEPSKAPPQPISLGESSRIAILKFIDSMLRPRTETRTETSSFGESEPWEWDGVSELPSFQEALDFFDYDPDFKSSRGKKTKEETIHTLFPIAKHLKWAAQSAETPRLLMQVCVLSLDASANPDFSELLRATALKVSRTTFTTWLAGVQEPALQKLTKLSSYSRDDSFDKTVLDLATKTQAILPGMVSALVKTLTGRATSETGTSTKQQALPSKAGLAALALKVLCETCALGFDDHATAKFRSQHSSSTPKESGSISTLEDLTELAARMSAEDTAQSEGTDSETRAGAASAESQKSSAPTLPAQAQMFLTSAERMQAALKQVLTSLSKSSTANYETLNAALELASTVWLRCRRTFAWAETSQGKLPALSGDLLRLVLDTVAAAQRSSRSVESKGWEILLTMAGPSSDIGRIDATGAELLASIDRLASDALEQLPLAIRSDQEEEVVRLSSRVRVASTLFQRLLEDESAHAVHLLLGKEGPHSLLSLHSLILGTGTTHSPRWTQNPAFTRWSSSLLAELQVADAADVAELDSRVRPRLQKLSVQAQRAVTEALRSIAAAATSGWVLRYGASSTDASASRKLPSTTVEEAFDFVLHFLREGSRFRTTRLTFEAHITREMCGSALYAANELLGAVSAQLAAPTSRDAQMLKLKRRTAKKLGKVVTQLVKSMLEEDMEEALDPDNILALISERQKSGTLNTLEVHRQSDSTIEFRKGMDIQSPGDAPAIDQTAGILQPGVAQAVSLQNQSPSATASSLVRQEKALRQVDVANAMLLNLLATGAELLGPDFQTQLIDLIYPLVCASTANATIVRTAGQSALARIAGACGYESSRDILRGCADWIVSATSQRIVTDLGPELELLSQTQATTDGIDGSTTNASSQLVPITGTTGGCALPLGSAQAAPYVLVEFVRLLGPESLASVEDAVDEVLDALDRYHGYESICEGLLGVLRALLSVSVDSAAASDEWSQATAGTSKSATDGSRGVARPNWLPQADADLTDFEEWYKSRRKPAEDETQLPEVKTENAEEADPDEPDGSRSGGEDSVNPPPSRAQQVVADILEKSVPFLSHPSAHIRAQVLRLLGYGVAVLAPQHRELELILILNRAWPLVLARLGSSATTPGPKQAGHRMRQPAPGGRRGTMLGKKSETEPYVWLEATKLVSSLAKFSADHYGQKIVDDAWPRFRQLLGELAHSLPSTRPTQRITSSATPASKPPTKVPALFVPDEHSLGSRLLAEVLETLVVMVHAVSIHLDDTQAWAMATDPLVLGALHAGQTSILRRAAEDLFRALTLRNADAMWLLLREFVTRPDSSAEPSDTHLSMACIHARRPELRLEPAMWDRLLQPV